MAAHSSVLAWRIPGMGEPGGLPSMGLHRVRHDCSDLAATAAAATSALKDQSYGTTTQQRLHANTSNYEFLYTHSCCASQRESQKL